MTSNAPAPSFLRIGDADRARAEQVLQEAYCAGRLDEHELDVRLGQALGAQTRQELAVSLSGLPLALPRPRAMSQRPPQASFTGGLAHLSALATWVFGPLFFYAASTPGSIGRREAARAFNFQLVAGLACILTAVVAGTLLPDALTGILMVTGWLGWLTLTIMGGARAIAGQPWRNPVTQVLRLEVLDSHGR